MNTCILYSVSLKDIIILLCLGALRGPVHSGPVYQQYPGRAGGGAGARREGEGGEGGYQHRQGRQEAGPSP